MTTFTLIYAAKLKVGTKVLLQFRPEFSDWEERKRKSKPIAKITKILDGPKLIKYSPNKTYSGLIGSFLLAIACVPFISYLELVNQPKFLNLIFFVIIVSTSSQFGDILISYFKRSSNIKDAGKIIPGHGGILDRFDGMIFAYPISYLLIIFNLFNIF